MKLLYKAPFLLGTASEDAVSVLEEQRDGLHVHMWHRVYYCLE